jgi:hypothetical protein
MGEIMSLIEPVGSVGGSHTAEQGSSDFEIRFCFREDGREDKIVIEVDRRMEGGGRKQKRKSKEGLGRAIFVP